MSEAATTALVFARTARRDGVPPRCVRCGAVCEPSMCGAVLCADHRPRLNDDMTAAQMAGRDRSRQAVWQAAKREVQRRNAPLADAIPAAMPKPLPGDTAPRTYRERVYDRLRAKGLA